MTGEDFQHGQNIRVKEKEVYLSPHLEAGGGLSQGDILGDIYPAFWKKLRVWSEDRCGKFRGNGSWPV